MHGRLFIICLVGVIGIASHATLPETSTCRLFVDDQADGLVFPRGPFSLNMIAPAEVVSVLAAVCVNPETNEKILVVASHVAYFEGELLFSDPSYGIFAPTFEMVEISLADMHFSETQARADVVQKSETITRSTHLEVDYNNGDIFNMKKLTLKVDTAISILARSSYVILDARSHFYRMPASVVIDSDDGLRVTSLSRAHNLVDKGSFTFNQIDRFMKDRRYHLSRTTKKARSL